MQQREEGKLILLKESLFNSRYSRTKIMYTVRILSVDSPDRIIVRKLEWEHCYQKLSKELKNRFSECRGEVSAPSIEGLKKHHNALW